MLQLCLRMPFPPREGGSMAMAAVADGLKIQGAEVVVLAFNTTKHPVQLEDIPSRYLQDFEISQVALDNQINWFNTLLNLFSNKSFHVSRFLSGEMSEELTKILQSQSFDFVVFESIFMSPYLPIVRQYSTAKTVLRSHNVEHLIWERILVNTKSFFKKKYLQIQTARLKEFELNVLSKYDLVAAISPTDTLTYKELQPLANVFTMGFGMEVGNIPVPKLTSQLRICFLGSMDWTPNLEGVEWFCSKIWPRISSAIPQLYGTIAGRYMPESFQTFADEQLTIVGEVKDSTGFYQSHNVMVVPLLSGSGVRIKVLEAMAKGIPVISTQIGAEGIEYVDGESIMIADDADGFVHYLKKALAEPQFLLSIAEGGRRLIAEKYDKKKLAGQLIDQVLALK